MATESLFVLLCAGAVVTAGPTTSASSTSDNRDNAIAATLAVQSALQQGRDYLLHGDCRAAVAVLESQLPYINGNQVYLKLLCSSFR